MCKSFVTQVYKMLSPQEKSRTNELNSSATGSKTAFQLRILKFNLGIKITPVNDLLKGTSQGSDGLGSRDNANKVRFVSVKAERPQPSIT